MSTMTGWLEEAVVVVMHSGTKRLKGCAVAVAVVAARGGGRGCIP
jgi:hypothetical protein